MGRKRTSSKKDMSTCSTTKPKKGTSAVENVDFHNNTNALSQYPLVILCSTSMALLVIKGPG